MRSGTVFILSRDKISFRKPEGLHLKTPGFLHLVPSKKMGVAWSSFKEVKICGLISLRALLSKITTIKTVAKQPKVSSRNNNVSHCIYIKPKRFSWRRVPKKLTFRLIYVTRRL